MIDGINTTVSICAIRQLLVLLLLLNNFYAVIFQKPSIQNITQYLLTNLLIAMML